MIRVALNFCLIWLYSEIIFVGLFFTPLAVAKDNWFCTEESSAIVDGAIQACGIGTGKDEAEARTKALDNAQIEFNKLCKASADCKDHEVVVDPNHRTTCEPSKEGYKCYRMLAFKVTAQKMRAENKVEAKHTAVDSPVSRTVPTSISGNQGVKSFNGKPKLKKGMSKRALIAEFGAPFKIDNDPIESNAKWFWYSGNMCVSSYAGDTSPCIVNVKNQKVESWSDFNPTYTSDLDDESEVATTPPAAKDTTSAQWSADFFKSQMEYCEQVLDAYTIKNASKITLLKKVMSSSDYASLKKSACFQGLLNVSQTTPESAWASVSLKDLEKAYGEIVSGQYKFIFKECSPFKVSATTSELKPAGGYLRDCPIRPADLRKPAAETLKTVGSQNSKNRNDSSEIYFEFNKCQLDHSSMKLLALEKSPLVGFGLRCLPTGQEGARFISGVKEDKEYVCTMEFYDGKPPLKQKMQVESSGSADLRLYVYNSDSKNIRVYCEREKKQCIADWNIYANSDNSDVNNVTCYSNYQRKPLELIKAACKKGYSPSCRELETASK